MSLLAGLILTAESVGIYRFVCNYYIRLTSIRQEPLSGLRIRSVSLNRPCSLEFFQQPAKI